MGLVARRLGDRRCWREAAEKPYPGEKRACAGLAVRMCVAMLTKALIDNEAAEKGGLINGSEMNREKFDNLNICFSAKSSANFTQKQVEDKLEKKKRRHLGPANNKKLIVFIDDMNMPTVEKEGAQPAIELLRQWMDHKQWYDYTDKGNQL